MKKLLAIIATLACCFSLFACVSQNGGAQSTKPTQSELTSKESQSLSASEKESVCEHSLTKINAKSSTCKEKGNIEFYYCHICKGYFLDENAESVTTLEQTKAPLAPHLAIRQEEIPATCGEAGVIEHWLCSMCGDAFIDEECKQKATVSELEIPSIEHANMVHRKGKPIEGDANGVVEHWYCGDCDGYFLDAQGKQKITEEETVLRSAINIPDFIVEIPSGKDAVVLQLTDTQIIDGAQSRPDVSSGDKITYATEKIKQYCYDYITEIIKATKPDFIILTGDIVYGKYDDNGSALTNFIAFMESFKIHWAPVFGNHENESNMGADWQSKQLEDATYCLFKQRDLTGNGNYSVGLMQDGVLKRVFYMLDANGCDSASSQSLANGHTVTTVGFGDDQIKWYTGQIQQIKELSPQTKFSFGFHIQLSVFGEALKKYGFNNDIKNHEIFINYLSNRQEGEFGYIGRQMKNAWDYSRKVFDGMKSLGVDSIFVGHEHCNSASVVFEGVRLQYGQKSSEYDRYHTISSEGKIIESAIWNKTGTPLVGGSVTVFSATSGEMIDGYIYYCNQANNLINSSFYTK